MMYCSVLRTTYLCTLWCVRVEMVVFSAAAVRLTFSPHSRRQSVVDEHTGYDTQRKHNNYDDYYNLSELFIN